MSASLQDGLNQTNSNCTASQLRACASGVGGLSSLEGLDVYLLDGLEHGVAQPRPDHSAMIGWGSVARAVLPADAGAPPREKRRLREVESERDEAESHASPGFMEFGGGSGGGFQILCGDKAIASLGGGGGGGAEGPLAHSRTPSPLPKGASLGGGGGGGVQLLFPKSLKLPADSGKTGEDTHAPWEAKEWYAWSTGGGSGCGSCKSDDAACLQSSHRLSCGVKMDDNGNVDRDLGHLTAESWRNDVLRRCFESGRLSLVGGGGGGAGGAGCCKAVPTLNFGFGFRAKLAPHTKQSEGDVTQSDAFVTPECCPDLAAWNVTKNSEESSSTISYAMSSKRRLNAAAEPTAWTSGAQAAASDGLLLADPFAIENGLPPPPGGANRMPTTEEMISQHAQRLGVDVQPLLGQLHGSSCEVPEWLRGAAPLMNLSNKSGSGTKIPQKVLKYIYKWNPIQGLMTESASTCEGWGDWCCVCHATQWRVACLPEPERSNMSWFLTEDCCESKMNRSRVTVHDVVPNRAESVVWKPNGSWATLPQVGSTDSFAWRGQVGNAQVCPMLLDSISEGTTLSEGRTPQKMALPTVFASITPERQPLMRASNVLTGEQAQPVSHASFEQAQPVSHAGFVAVALILVVLAAFVLQGFKWRFGHRFSAGAREVTLLPAAKAGCRGESAGRDPGYTELSEC
eukprot:TRINITY_DN37047_c0_g1_i1.p1 TRINITY_DN37047_c0_g1~~TRINITY_DN37047_c0_g1_i1.p1  ORF type:complete len:788 (+),score=82.10 TRINITY_DN37047_c0_g1_i1:315-2366(+)